MERNLFRLPPTKRGVPDAMVSGGERNRGTPGAEAVFTAHLEKATAKAFYTELKTLVAEIGRDRMSLRCGGHDFSHLPLDRR